MAHIQVSRELKAPPDEAWAALADLQSHVQWMRDARSIEFLTDSRRGVGTIMEVLTVVGPFRTTDIMEVVGWQEGHSIDVAHKGLITGHGTLSLTSDQETTVVRWEETLTFPWWLGGAVTAWLARPVLGAIWKSNLRRLEEAINSR